MRASPDEEPEATLLSLYRDKGRQPKDVAKSVKRNEDWGFPSSAMEAALASINTGDPDLRRTRSFVHELADDRRLGLQAVKFGARASAPYVPDGVKPWPPRTDDRPPTQTAPGPAQLLTAIATELGPRLRVPAKQGDKAGQLEGRRAHSVLMLSADFLSVAMGLTAEEAVPILTEALGAPKGVTAPRPNPRRVRMRALTDTNLGRERIREILELLQPWITQLEEQGERMDLTAAKAAQLRDELARAEKQLAEASEHIERLNASLETASADLAALESRYRDSGARADSDVRQIRGRVAAHLESRLRTKLATASEALGVETPRVTVASRMVQEATEELEGELNWLRSLD